MTAESNLITTVYGCHEKGGEQVHVDDCPSRALDHIYDGGGFYRVEIPRMRVYRGLPTDIVAHPWRVTGGPLIKVKVFPTWRQAQDAADEYATGRRRL